MTEQTKPKREAAIRLASVHRWVFSLRLAGGGAATEIDVTLDGLWRLADELVAEFRKVDPFRDDEVFLQRLVPRMEWSGSSEVSVEYMIGLPPDLGSARRALYRLADEPDGSGPLRCLSLWLCARRLGKMCAVNLPVSWLFESELEVVTRRPSGPEENPGESHPAPEIHLEAYAPLEIGDDGYLLAVLLRPWEEARRCEGVAEVTIERRETLLEPAQRAVEDYRAKLVGTRRHGDLRIFLDRAALEQQTRQLERRHDDAEVHMGLLLGEVYVDSGGERFVDITAILPVCEFDARLEDLLLRLDTWQEVFWQARHRFPGLHRIGWFRTQATSDQGERSLLLLDWLKSRAYRTMTDGAELLTQSDLQLQHSLFPEPWQVMMHLDARSAKPVFFQQVANSYQPCRGFYLYSRNP